MKEPALLGTGYFSGPLGEKWEMPINIEEVIEKAFEQAFVKALEQILQSKAEALFKKAFEDRSPLARRLEEKTEEGLQRFMQEGIRWERKKAGFKKIDRLGSLRSSKQEKVSS